ncbi:MAG: hypothetical protein ABIT76_11935 [Chthoniobacterales bacterium]
MSGLFLTAGRRLRLLAENDPHTHWWSLDETRFCNRCEHLIVGRDIVITLDEHEAPHFACPSFRCPGTFANWEYPQLHL